jgi:hypothetical protein
MLGSAICAGFAILVVVGISSVGKFFLSDPCEGDGTLRDPVHFQYVDEDDEEEDDG